MEPVAAAAAAPHDGCRVDVAISHNRIEHRLPSLDPRATTVGQLQALMEERTGVKAHHQKLIHKGRTLADPGHTLESLLPVAPAGRVLLKLVMVGARAAEIEALDAAAQAAAKGRGRVISDLRLLSSGADGARRRPGGLRRRQYGFQAIEVLPGLPDQDRARAILEELAEDPGVLHVMAMFKWSVGALCELYPEGYVGFSDVCVMGLNQNKGQKILLRLRTDDLQGWRKTLSIKKVLYHELAHNEHGDHDDDFYRLMRRIEKEVVAFNSSGRSLGGPGGLLMYVRLWLHESTAGSSNHHNNLTDLNPNPNRPQADAAGRGGFVGGSGRLGGESGGLAGVLSARAMAGLAAAQRKTAEEQEIEDACPSGRRGEGERAHARPHDAASPVVELGRQAREVVEVAPMVAAPPGAASGGTEAAVAADGEEEDGSAVMDVASVNQEDRSSVSSCCGGQHEHEHEHEQESAAPSGPPPVGLAAVAVPAPAPAPATPPSIIAAPEAAVAVAMVDEGAVEQLLALGFARAAVVAALGRAGGNVERAANLLVASEGVVEAAEEAAPGPAAMGLGGEGGEEALELDPTTREGRAVAAARRLVREELRGDEQGRAAALSTLKGMIQAVLVRFCVLVHYRNP